MKRVVWGAATATLVLVSLGVLISSMAPDGLGRVAAALGFASRTATVGPPSPFANYATRYVHTRWAAQASAGLLGVVLLYGFGVLFGRALKRGAAQRPRSGT